MQTAIGEERLAELRQWFSEYARRFKIDTPEIRHVIDLKENHTLRVCDEILWLGGQLGLAGHQLHVAEIIALFHDVGRFEQYARHGTFLDAVSEDHAELGIRVLLERKVLAPFDEKTKDLIVGAVRFHNRAALPGGLDSDGLFYARLIRDADKLDIWRIVTEHYRNGTDTNRAVGLALPDTRDFSREVFDDLQRKKIVDLRHVRNLNDLKLFQAGWSYDLNFRPTRKRVRERRYLETIRSVLPQSERLDSVFQLMTATCFP